ncbi:hypothetical protein PHMEG_00026596, partial [Phytophthora megakarya]
TSKVNLTLQINTAAGPVRLATPAPCLIIEEDEDEFSIGKDVLEMLGIDVDRQLEQLVVNEDAVDENPVDFEDSFAIGTESDDEVKAAVEELLEAAIANGYPPRRRDELPPRPWRETFRRETRNEALHFDFLHLGESYGDNQYLLALKVIFVN